MYKRYNRLEAMTSESSIRKRNMYKYPKALQIEVYTGRIWKNRERGDGGQGGWGGGARGEGSAALWWKEVCSGSESPPCNRLISQRDQHVLLKFKNGKGANSNAWKPLGNEQVCKSQTSNASGWISDNLWNRQMMSIQVEVRKPSSDNDSAMQKKSKYNQAERR